MQSKLARRASRVAIATGAVVVLIGGTVADAAPCRAQPAFGPGNWRSRTFDMSDQFDDGFGTLNLWGQGGFELTVDRDGVATGEFRLAGGAGSVMDDGTDQSHAETTYEIVAQLSGTGTYLDATGEMHASMSGEIDVAGTDGVGLPGTHNDEMPDFTNEFTRPWVSHLQPTVSGCGAAIGQYGTGDEADPGTMWYAYRLLGTEPDVDLGAQLDALVDEAMFVWSMDPIDTDVLAAFVLHALAFDGLVSSTAACHPGELDGLTNGNPQYELLSRVVTKAVITFAETAMRGAYATTDVIDVATLLVESAAVGFRNPAGECSGATPDEIAIGALNTLEDVLLQRYRLAEEQGNAAEMTMISTAAYQLGFQRVMEEVES